MSSDDPHNGEHAFPQIPQTASTPSTSRFRRASIVQQGNVQSATPRIQNTEDIQWHVPVYDNNDFVRQRPEELLARCDNLIPFGSEGSSRPSVDNDVTVANGENRETDDPYKKYSLSSYEHPYDIQPPPDAYAGPGVAPLNVRPRRSRGNGEAGLSQGENPVPEYRPQEPIDPAVERALKRRGIPSNVLDLYALGTRNHSEKHHGMAREYSDANSDDYSYSSARRGMRRKNSNASSISAGSDVLDPDDPRLTGVQAKYLEDPEDIEKNALRQMDYKTRRKHLTRIKIEFNVSSMINRQEFLIKLAKALMTFGAPSHRIESQLIAAARILEVEAEFIHLPGVIICSFGDQELGCSETHFVKCGGRLSLGALHKVHLIYRNVVHDEISAKRATADLEALLTAPPLYSMLFRLSSSLELASKNIGFGLQIGSDFYLLLDRQTRRKLDELAANLATTVVLTGTWKADNGTLNNSIPEVGTWTFEHALPAESLNIVDGCYRPQSFPWYLQPFPSWTTYVIVPVFSTLSSLANLQPFKSKQLPVMVVISCASYASNKIANHYIFNRSDVVSAIGAFTVGILGNVYSRKMGGTAFTSMVTGVLFLVPSGLSQAGGITASGNGIDIGGAMIAVTIGITVGLFMSQALVYAFGSRKNAAVFSF
ncbi:hypothetical protein H0H92_014491 [Tricholoma furcatifolium]|nr:hypothetical protein H0H92_014491 [Tricholoma furcatifolium]